MVSLLSGVPNGLILENFKVFINRYGRMPIVIKLSKYKVDYKGLTLKAQNNYL